MEGGFKETRGWEGRIKELEKCGGGLDEGRVDERVSAGPLLMEGKEEPCFLSTSCKPSCLWLDGWKLGFQLLPHLHPLLPPLVHHAASLMPPSSFLVLCHLLGPLLLELVDDLSLLLQPAPGL